MRILFIHSDNIEYETLSKMKMAEENTILIYAMQDALGVRCDVESCDESMGKKVREATVECVPYIIVIGDGEIDPENTMFRLDPSPSRISRSRLLCLLMS